MTKRAKQPSTNAKKPALTPEQEAALALSEKITVREKPKKAGKGKAQPEPAPTVEQQKAETPKIGRPTTYTQELADEICAQLAEGKSMRTVCLADGMPAMSTVFKWLREHPLFSEQYTKAKAEAADAMVEEMTDIADDGRNDWMEVHDKDGNAIGWKVNGEHVQRSRLRVETRKWIAAKLKPKKYGDKIDMNHGVQPENPLATLLGQISGSALPVVKDGDDA